MRRVTGKLEGGGTIVLGGHNRTDTEDVLNEVGDSDYYQRQIR